MKEKRELWLDTAKGIGIIAVVMGHSGNEFAHRYLFWFHMPLFFVISGYLFKEKDNFSDLKKWIRKRSSQLLIPYISFGITISILLFLFDFSIIGFLKRAIKLVYGGQLLTGYYGVFWFVTCLYLTQVTFACLVFCIKKKQGQISILVFFYLLAHFIASIPSLRDFRAPWNFDIVFLAIVYYAIGYYCKGYIHNMLNKTSVLISSVLLALTAIIIDSSTDINFEMDMKVNIYTPILMDIVIPLIFCMCIFTISYKLSKLRQKTFFEALGSVSLTIMYLHMPINIFIQSFTGEYNLIIYTVIGIVIPFFIHHLLLARINLAKNLLLGIQTDIR